MRHLPRLTRLEQVVSHRRTEQPPAEPEDSDGPITLQEAPPWLFRYGSVGDPGSLGFRRGEDGRRHIVITHLRYGRSTNRFDLEYDAMLAQLAPAFDAEWHAAGCPRIFLLTQEEAAKAVQAIDRGDLEWRDTDGKKTYVWWSDDDDAAKRIPWPFLELIDSTARVLRDQGETVNSLEDLRALLCEALAQEN